MIFCGRSPRHLYVANRLCRAGIPLAIVQETGREWTLGKIGRMLHPANVHRKLWRWARDRRRYSGAGEARYFFGDGIPQLDRRDLVSSVPHINHPDVFELASRLKPDIVAVFGTSLLRGQTLSLGRLGILNLHGGLSPHYRGADCTFWALHNEEPENVGCTIHFIDSGIDTGRIVAHVCPEVHAGDTELTLFYRGVRASAEIYAEALDRFERGESLGAVQAERGRLYQVKQRTWRHERDLASRLANGMLRDISLPLRVRWFASSSSTQVGGDGA